MTDATAMEDDLQEAAPKKGRGGLFIGLALAALGGAGGFFATQSGLLGLTGGENPEEMHAKPAALPDLEFVEIAPILISLNDSSVAGHLRFRAQLEVAAGYRAEVAHLEPRIVDLINGYLRALRPADFEDPLILTRLRAQLLRRLQIVAGEGRIKDVLIMEFILT